MRLLLAEDDRYLSAMLSKGLREHAYAVDVVPDGDAAIGLSAINEYDVIMLDVMMPRRDGFAVCREIRRRGITAPVLMLTARDSVADKVEGLDAGADDYLAKPFEFAELLARLRALLRRARDIREPEITVADLIVDTRGQTAHHEGVRAARVPCAQCGTRRRPCRHQRPRLGRQSRSGLECDRRLRDAPPPQGGQRTRAAHPHATRRRIPARAARRGVTR